MNPAPASERIAGRVATRTRLLFVHAATDQLHPEYKVHKLLAEHAVSHEVDSHFLWQRAARSTGDNRLAFTHPDRVHFIEFGRDYSMVAPPGRGTRSALMLRSLPSAIRTVVALARELSPDVIYSSQQATDIGVARVLAFALRVPHVIHVHYTVGPWLGRHVLRAIRRAPRVFAVSEFIRQNALLQGVSPGSVSTVPNAMAVPEVARRGCEAADLRHEFGWPADARVVIAAGRLDPMKGHLSLIDAFAGVHRRMPQARLLICGRTFTRADYLGVLTQRVMALGLQDCVALAGYRHDLPSLLLGADVFCLATEMEPFGLVFLEAMAASLPIVAFRSGAVPEIVVDGVTGLLSYPDARDGLMGNLLRCLTDTSLARNLGAAGFEHLRRFSPAEVVPRWVSLLRGSTDRNTSAS